MGQPVRHKLMADGVVLAWGVEVPLLRKPQGHTHLIWFSVADEALADLFRNMIDPDASRQIITKAIIFRVPGQK